MVKNLFIMWKTQVQSQHQDDPLEKGMATHSSILAGESHRQRSLASYSPWGRKELDTTEQLTHKEVMIVRFLAESCQILWILNYLLEKEAVDLLWPTLTQRLLPTQETLNDTQLGSLCDKTPILPGNLYFCFSAGRVGESLVVDENSLLPERDNTCYWKA